MTKTVNLKRGDRFGKLHIIERVKSDRHGKAHYLCYCTCGRQTTVSRSRLITGKTKSCGCLKSQTKHGDARRGKHSQLYDIWANLPQRCRIENCSRMHRYSDKQVSVFRYWKKYTTFKKWALSRGYAPGLFLIKIDKSRNYTPHNCKFVEMSDPLHHRSNIRHIEVDGVLKSRSEWCRDLHISMERLNSWLAISVEFAVDQIRFYKMINLL